LKIDINRLEIITTVFVKSLLTSLCQREKFPSLAKRGDLPARSRFGEGRGEIFLINVNSILIFLIKQENKP
jgi:hypothetical protein